MRKNKYFLVLASFFIFMSLTLGIIFKKYIFLLLHHSIYYCVEVVKSLSVRLPINWGEVGILIFLVLSMVVILKLVMTLVRAVRMKNRLRSTAVYADRVERVSGKLSLENKVFVFKNSYPSAFCFGFSKPKIYVSTGLVKILSRSELEAVLRHEKYHLENKDVLVLFLASLTQTLFPFFPIISDISKKHRVQNEVAADEAAIKGMRDTRPLVSVLRKLVVYEPRKHLAMVSSLADWDSLEIRIKKLVNKQTEVRKIPIGNVSISLLFLLILGGLASTPTKTLDNYQHSYYTCSRYDNQKHNSKSDSGYSFDRGRLLYGFFMDRS